MNKQVQKMFKSSTVIFSNKKNMNKQVQKMFKSSTVIFSNKQKI